MKVFRTCVLFIGMAAFFLLSFGSGYAVTNPVPGAVVKDGDFSIFPPWAEYLERGIIYGYGEGANQGTDDPSSRNDYYAINFSTWAEDMIFPVAPGTIVYAGRLPWLANELGNFVFIDHGNGYQSLYADLKMIDVRILTSVDPDKRVETYTLLGVAGNAVGWHFALYKNAAFDTTNGPFGGQSVVPEPFANCIKNSVQPCENLLGGDVLSRVASRTITNSVVALGWTNPPNTVYYHLQVVPLNRDGPGIDLVISDAAMVRQEMFVLLPPIFGMGNYVLLPGSYYSWRIRFSSAQKFPLDLNDPSWSQWSPPQWFKTHLPNSSTIQLQEPADGSVTANSTPTVRWTDSESSNFYYEIQLSADPEFRTGSDAVAAVYWNLVHGGMSNPLNSWTVPATHALEPGTYYFRVRQRVQATLAGTEEQGIPWTPAQSFTVVP